MYVQLFSTIQESGTGDDDQDELEESFNIKSKLLNRVEEDDDETDNEEEKAKEGRRKKTDDFIEVKNTTNSKRKKEKTAEKPDSKK